MQKINLRIIAILIAFLIFCGALGYLVWQTSLKTTKNRAIMVAEALEAGLSDQHVSELSAESADINKLEYYEIKNSFERFVQKNPSVRFVSILIKKPDGIYIAVDSELPASDAYSPPGQKYEEASQEDYAAFESGETTVTRPFTDRWGKYVSVLVPMQEDTSVEVMAVLCVDYPLGSWYQHTYVALFYAGAFAFCVMTIFVFFRQAIRQNKLLRKEKQKIIESERQLKESETLFRALFDKTAVGLALGSKERFVVSSLEYRPVINSKFESITGRTFQELSSVNWLKNIHPDEAARVYAHCENLAAGKIDGYDTELRLIRPDKSEIWVHMTVSAVHLEDYPEVNCLYMLEDITARRQMERRVRDSEQSKTILLDNIPGMAYRCKMDRNWTMEFVSEGCYALTGYKPESLVNNCETSYNELILPKYQEYLWNKWMLCIAEKTKLTVEYEIITANGEIRWVWEQGQGVFDENGKLIALEGLILDITSRIDNEKRLKFIGEHDQLTGLYNRLYFEGMIEQRAKNEKSAALLINIRKFTLLNMVYGYAYGDAIIKEVAASLRECVSDERMLFHVSIDRFIVFVPAYESEAELRTLCEQVLCKLRGVLEPRIIGANIGVVEVHEQDCEADSIIKYASIAAQSAGAYQNFGFSFYSANMAQRVERVNEIKNELAEAIYAQDQNRLFLHYQPILNLRTNTISGFEALARFKSDRLGMVPPCEFIPIAEETQLIVPLGRLVMRNVCSTISRFTQQAGESVFITFNISAIQLLRDDFLADLGEAIEQAGVDPHMLGIEITESVFLDEYGEINNKLERIRQLGIKISIDDFGTGYSSFARERELNVDTLKIDKFFIDKLMEGRPEHALTSDIISMGHKLGHSVIAEGVEYELQKQYLVEHQCDEMQGFLFSEPVPEEEALAIVLRQKKN